jgi:hypothetical protein
MTPEEHIERAERLLEDASNLMPEDGHWYASRAAVHVAIAAHKKQFPPDSGRPIKSSGRMHDHVNTHFCSPNCPAFGTDSGNYPRSISDNPQA